ncbi:hypothetical protein TNCV_4765791 [Trichonephila clavipes]|nr:hypothetical protein TNCV_4765791 [Trichonephila clavipes]
MRAIDNGPHNLELRSSVRNIFRVHSDILQVVTSNTSRSVVVSYPKRGVALSNAIYMKPKIAKLDFLKPRQQ